MYWWMSIDALIRIAFAMLFLFVIVPALAWPRRQNTTLLEWLFWNLGVGITVITLVGQVSTLANLFSLITLLLTAGLIILIGRSIFLGISPWTLLRRSSEFAFLAFLNILDRRVNVPRRIRRKLRRTMAAIHQKTDSLQAKMQIGGWIVLTIIAAGLRLFRPLASANLGFPDTYVHLYLLKLLDEGLQVDPAFGPYPRGLHFVLMAIHDLTNVDVILLMNFFGAFVGVLMTLAVADTARRLSQSVMAGLVSGFLYATLVGGPSQAFVLGPLDVVIQAFQRQTSTLPQELALVLLLPAVMFFLDFLRGRNGWHLTGFAGCAAAICAVHSAVVLPLFVMLLTAILAVAIHERVALARLRPLIVSGFVAALTGSFWAIAFIPYPYFGGKSEAVGGFSTRVIATAYTPFINTLLPGHPAGISSSPRANTPLTPFLIGCMLFAIALIVASFVGRDELRVKRLWLGLIFLIFVLVHFAPALGLPQPLETGRNVQWMMMSMTMVIGVAITGFASFVRSASEDQRPRMATAAVFVVLLVVWTIRIPHLNDPPIYDRIVNFSGYGASTLAVLKIQQSLQPYTWTLVSYGQEFPMVLRRGFHVAASQFLDQYDPTLAVVPIPTPEIFVIVEKTPHSFEIANWAARFSRADLENRLQTWVYLYQTTHKNVRIFLEDDHVRVYQIERTPEEMQSITRPRRT